MTAGTSPGFRAEFVTDLQAWALSQGLRGAEPEILLDGLCRRLNESGVPLWRAFLGGRTLHPQWAGHSCTWERGAAASKRVVFGRGPDYEVRLRDSPFATLIRQLEHQRRAGSATLRRRLRGPYARLDYAVLEELAAAGATDYFAQLVAFGAAGDPSRGTGVGYSFATDHPAGFHDDDLALIEASLPALSLAVMAYVGHAIAAGLLEAYLGPDAGRRVHAGEVERGSVQSIRAALWFADVRGFTTIAETLPGVAVIELLNEVFETVIAPLRSRGGEVLKFLGDGVLAIFGCEAAGDHATCRQALAAAEEARAALDRLNSTRKISGKPTAGVDIALHLGEVLYGNVGAVDRLDFTVIGPAVNELARIEALCDKLDRRMLVSAEFAAAVGRDAGLISLGPHRLRGVRDEREIFGLQM